MIFCLVIGLLLAFAAEWLAKAIEKNEDYPTIGWRIIVFGWVVYFAAIGFSAYLAIGADKEMKRLEERIVQLENQTGAPADTLNINDLVK